MLFWTECANSQYFLARIIKRRDKINDFINKFFWTSSIIYFIVPYNHNILSHQHRHLTTKETDDKKRKFFVGTRQRSVFYSNWAKAVADSLVKFHEWKTGKKSITTKPKEDIYLSNDKCLLSVWLVACFVSQDTKKAHTHSSISTINEPEHSRFAYNQFDSIDFNFIQSVFVYRFEFVNLINSQKSGAKTRQKKNTFIEEFARKFFSFFVQSQCNKKTEDNR